MVANFTIFYSETADGDYKTHTAQIIDWPVHSRGRPWDYGPCVSDCELVRAFCQTVTYCTCRMAHGDRYGNWNPAPLVHPNGSIYLLDHAGQIGWKHGEAIITADSWRGPYRMVVSDSDSARWKGTTENAEDPCAHHIATVASAFHLH